MRIYFAGPLFSAAERDWNATLATALRDAGHEVFLPQEQEPGKDAPGIFATDVGGIDWADCLVAIMDGADPRLRHLLGGRLRVPEEADRAGPHGHAAQREQWRLWIQPDAHRVGDGPD